MSTHTKVRNHLYFYRYKDKFSNLPAIFPLELLYKIFFIVRSIIGYLLPLLGLATFVVAIFTNMTQGVGPEDYGAITTVGTILAISFAAWIVLMIFEGIFARIAHKILKVKKI